MTKANIGNSQVVIKIGQNAVLKAYRGSNVIYSPVSAAPISVSPLHLANGFLSTLGNDTVNESEFPNAALSNGYLNVLRLENTTESEFPNAVLSNGYLGVLHIDPIVIPLPNAPTSLSATAGNAQIVLSWTAPTNTAISDYTIEYTPAGAGTGYSLSGYATTAANGNYTTSGEISNNPTWQHSSADYVLSYIGESVGWALFPGTIAGGYTGGPIASQVCGYPGGGEGTCSEGSVTGDWNEGISSGAGSFTVAAATATPQNVSTGSSNSSYTLTGLTNGTAYTVRVAAVNSAGTGAYTAASSGVTPNAASVPGAPTLVRNGNAYWACQEGDNAVMWNVPSSNGGSAITGYVWRIGSGSLTSVSPSTGTSQAFSNPNWTGGRVVGLPTGGSFQVAAVNAIGTGPFASITLQQDCN